MPLSVVMWTPELTFCPISAETTQTETSNHFLETRYISKSLSIGGLLKGPTAFIRLRRRESRHRAFSKVQWLVPLVGEVTLGFNLQRSQVPESPQLSANNDSNHSGSFRCTHSSNMQKREPGEYVSIPKQKVITKILIAVSHHLWNSCFEAQVCQYLTLNTTISDSSKIRPEILILAHSFRGFKSVMARRHGGAVHSSQQ